MPRIFTTVQQARDGAKSVAAGYDGQLRIALSDGITSPHLSAFLAKCRDDDPEVGIHLIEVPLSQQTKGFREDLYDADAGFAQSNDVGGHDPLVVAAPAKHPLLTRKRVPLEEVLRYPVVMGDLHACEGYCRQIARVLRPLEKPGPGVRALFVSAGGETQADSSSNSLLSRFT